MTALRSHESHQAVKTDHGQREPRDRKECEQGGFKTRPARQLADSLIERLHVDRNGAIDRSNLCMHPRFDRLGRHYGVDEHYRPAADPIVADAPAQQVKLWFALLREAAVLDVIGHTNNGEPRVVVKSYGLNLLSDGIFMGKNARSQEPAENCLLFLPGTILLGETAAADDRDVEGAEDIPA